MYARSVQTDKVKDPDIVGRDNAVAMNMLAGVGLRMEPGRIAPLGGINDHRSGQVAHQEPARGATSAPMLPDAPDRLSITTG